MQTFILIALVISSIVLIASVMLQSGKDAGLSGSIAGGADGLYGKKKSRGYDAIFEKMTKISATVFMLSAFINSLL
ncbi:protein translocase subunit secG [Alkalibaculum bacchi]|uniref:Protein-export membrane protein SecG n=1 Tax=Alkalibaculum bacchi TaxID=645887 RepID=A0A366IFX6_9FIRM|nr:preprotein translocase subunit SecG [Alkalibaculum bacchi]RBP69026.1 protein translocase subunit secG [Alkalibaculum bacchi]